MRLADKVAIVTGAGRGIGQEGEGWDGSVEDESQADSDPQVRIHTVPSLVL
jgi:hypothetical protein